MSAKARILQHARNLFLKYGVKSITLDDIAKDLGISKKTIYQYFDNKASIVYETTLDYFREEKAEMEHIHGIAENAIDELVKICIWAARTLENMSPNIMHEVSKYYPKAFTLHREYLSDFVFEKLKENLERGMQEGLYREDLDSDLVARIRISQFDSTLQEDIFPIEVFDVWEVQVELFILYLFGIVTPKGRELVESYRTLIPRKNLRTNTQRRNKIPNT
ncbi:MAG: TetR/AcrR family transcriptional regulator [Bacteroidota bacterium]